jgi:hypothetical protein
MTAATGVSRLRWRSIGCGDGRRLSAPVARVLRKETVQEEIEIDIAASRKRDGEACADRVAIAPSHSLSIQISRLHQIGHYPLSRAFGYLHIRGDVPHAHTWVLGDAQQREAVIGEELEGAHTPKRSSESAIYKKQIS